MNNLNPQAPNRQGESVAAALLMEAKRLLKAGLEGHLSLHEAAHFLLKVENWEASK